MTKYLYDQCYMPLKIKEVSVRIDHRGSVDISPVDCRPAPTEALVELFVERDCDSVIVFCMIDGDCDRVKIPGRRMLQSVSKRGRQVHHDLVRLNKP